MKESFEDVLVAWIHAPDPAAKHALQPRLEELLLSTWRDGSEQERLAVLSYISSAGLGSHVAILEQSLKHESETVRIIGFGMTHALAANDTRVLTPTVLESAINELQTGTPDTKGQALELLVDFDPTATLSTIEWVAHTASDESLRTRANLMLVELGQSEPLQEVLDHLRRYPSHYGIATSLWSNREKLALPLQERSFLRERIEEFCASIERRLAINDDPPLAELLASLNAQLADE